MAAKFSFLSQSMKTGSIVYLNGSNVQSELEINEENEYLTSVNGKQKRCPVCCKPSVCDTFHKGFTKTSNRKTHRRIHTGDKPYVCDTFEKGFTRNIYLKIHQRVHKKNLLCVARCKKDLHKSVYALVKNLNVQHSTEDLQIHHF